MATNQFLSTGPSWSIPSNWSLGYVPYDDSNTVIFASTSATCSMDISGTCSNIDFSTYANRFNFKGNSLFVVGDVTFGNLMTFSFSGAATYSAYNLLITTSSNITTNGFTVSVPTLLFNYNANNTYNLIDTFNINQKFGTGALNTGSVHTINGSPINLYSGFEPHIFGQVTPSYMTGTSNINAFGPLSLRTGITASSIGSAPCGVGLNFTINPSATIVTQNTGAIYFNACTVSIIGTPAISGSVFYNFSCGNSFNFIAASSSPSYVLPIIISTSINTTSPTINLLSDIHFYGISSGGLTLNNFKAYCYNVYSNITNLANGTTVIVITGTSSLVTTTFFASTTTTNNFVLNSPGKLNSLVLSWAGTSFVWTSGLVTSASLTFDISHYPILDINTPITNLTITKGGTATLNSPLVITNNLIIGSLLDAKFDGNYAWTTTNFNYYQSAIIKTYSYVLAPPSPRTGVGLSSGLTYAITNSMICVPAGNFTDNIFSFRSLTPGVYADLIFSGGYSQTNTAITANDINSSAGNTIWVYNFNGYTSSVNTLNWNSIDYTSMQQINMFVS